MNNGLQDRLVEGVAVMTIIVIGSILEKITK
jgi:hypothetical protein